MSERKSWDENVEAYMESITLSDSPIEDAEAARIALASTIVNSLRKSMFGYSAEFFKELETKINDVGKVVATASYVVTPEQQEAYEAQLEALEEAEEADEEGPVAPVLKMVRAWDEFKE